MPTILVADDNSNIQKMVTLALKDQGITVVAVGNGEAAVKKLADVRPDVVLADIFMPVRNGYEVCEYVKGDDRFAHIPVVLLVGAFDPLDEHEVERVHADGVLKKPFVPPNPLIDLVKSLLQRAAHTPTEAPSLAGRAAGTAGAISSALAAQASATEATRLEETQRLTEAEILEAARRSMQLSGPAARPPVPVAAPPPEAEEFAAPPPPQPMDEAHMPLAFRELLDAEEGAQPAEESEELEEASQGRSFEASSVSGFEFPRQRGAESAPSAELAEARTQEEEEEDHWGGIKEEMKQPSPPEPPIPVSFAPSEPVEIITEETPAAPGIEISAAPDLVSSPAEWEPPPTPPSAASEIFGQPEKPQEELVAEIPAWEAPSPPPPAPVARIEDAQDFEPFVIKAETPPRREIPSPPPSAFEGLPAMRVTSQAEKISEADETQQFSVPLAEKVEHEMHPPSTFQAESPIATSSTPTAASTFKAVWDRLEEITVAGAAVGAGAHLISHREEAAHPPVAPARGEPEVAPRTETPVRAEAATIAPQESPVNLVDEVTRKVLAQLHPDFIEQITRELVRPIIEAIVRRELNKK